ncbi:MAG: hypothetical protein AAB229_08015 [Candidatus Hydrogenedentota bacterium]
MSKIRFHDPESLAMTDRCADFRSFMAGMKGSLDRNLQDHLKSCPTCRKVAAEGIRNLMIAEKSLEPPEALRDLARELVEKSEGSGVAAEEEAEIELIVAFSQGQLQVQGLPAQIAKGPCARIASDGVAYPIGIIAEPIDGKFLLKVSTQRQTDAVAILKSSSGEDVAPARKLLSTLTWPGLVPAIYRLRISGKKGSTGYRIKLASD